MFNKIHYFLLILLMLHILNGCISHEYWINAHVINKTSQEIGFLEVEIYDKSYVIRNLTVGSRFSFKYKPIGDAHYTISYGESDSQYVIQNIGYVTRGMNLEDEIIIYSDRIDFSIVRYID